jgi:hypothetical protein
MKSRIKPLFQCPYCPRGRGIIAFDLDTVLGRRPEPLPPVVIPAPVPTGDKQADTLAWLRHINESCPGVDHRFDPGAPGGIFVFDPDAVASGPCKHVIMQHPDVRAACLAPLASTTSCWTYAGIWQHPWFSTNDPNGYLYDFLWDAVIDDSDKTHLPWRPAQPHRVRRVSRSWHSKHDVWEISVDMPLVVAQEPAVFLEELQRLDKQFQQASFEGKC